MDHCIRIHRKKMRQKIHNLRSINPKEYWKIINSGRKQISPNISINVLFYFIKTLNTGEPENEGDPPVFNQDTDDLNNIINAPITVVYGDSSSRICGGSCGGSDHCA